MEKILSRPKSLKEAVFSYCPGCGHGIAHRIAAECIDELDIREKTIGIAPVGCAVFAYDYFNFDVVEVPHGRPPAAATGIKRTNPEKIVFTYQGDGDIAAIGMSEIIHAANRGENITVIFINNANYGMTGGQMAPTTLIGQVTETTPFGRDPKREGYPIKMCELLSSLEAPVYLERTAIYNPQNIINAKRAVKKAFECQIQNKGFSLVEIVSNCPVDWGMTPLDSIKWVEEVFIKTFPLGVIKDKTGIK
ncbi:MAG: 2-oxoglutarate oxidoreductase [Elusimicrobiota bacterium]|jgi:2-oxoglutarate ferredoxin oxidoreductase subunit beta|nr:2-oxoglutarate oxidoreductase [Elusimicrobiota bacterium]